MCEQLTTHQHADDDAEGRAKNHDVDSHHHDGVRQGLVQAVLVAAEGGKHASQRCDGEPGQGRTKDGTEHLVMHDGDAAAQDGVEEVACRGRDRA